MIFVHIYNKKYKRILSIGIDGDIEDFDLMLHILENSKDVYQYKVAMITKGYVPKETWGMIGQDKKKWVTKFDDLED